MSPKLRLRLLQYGLPFVVVILIACIKFIFLNELHESIFLLFFCAVLVSGWYGTLRSGLIATVISGLVVNYIFIPPAFAFSTDPPSLYSTGIFFIEGTLFSIIIKAHSLARKKIAESSERFRIVAEGVSDYIVLILNPSGEIQSINNTAEKTLGYNRDEIIKLNISNLYNTKDRRRRLAKKHIFQAIHKGHKEISGWRLNKYGKSFWIQGTLSAIKNNDGSVRSLVAVFKDMTREKIQQRERDDFISIATHELKQPVTSIMLYAQILYKHIQTQSSIDLKSVQLTKNLIDQLNKMSELIKFLLDFTRIQRGKIILKKEKVNLQEIFGQIKASIHQSCPEYKLFIENNEKNYVIADRERIRQVLVNLITNAIKYSPNSRQINLKTISNKKHITIFVQDFGIGIAKDKQEMIFSRFYRIAEKQTKISGLGLGLYITSEILKKHASKLYVDSQLGKGSTFYFSLRTAK